MKLVDILIPIEEGAKHAYKRYGMKLVKCYRCTSGPKKGKLASSPSVCASRKDPKKVRQGRKNARMNKSSRIRKTLITKKSAVSKSIRKMNRTLE